MTVADLYRGYIDCLNSQDWALLHRFVHDEVHYNGDWVGLSGYRAMLERDFREIPDLYFDVQILISDPPFIASRIQFHCTPRGTFFDLPINGKKVSFSENVFYEYLDERIRNVWSVIDKATVAAQL